MSDRHSLASLALAVLVSAALAAGALAGCSRHRGPPGIRAADERSLRRLEGVARRDLDCPSVRLVPLRDAVYQADGCGRLAEYANNCRGRRCNWDPVEVAASHASRDLGCPMGQLSVVRSTATQRYFSGCGRNAAYSLVCGPLSCDWLPMAASTGRGAGTPVATRDPGLSMDAVVIPPPPGASAATTAEDDLAIPASSGVSPAASDAAAAPAPIIEGEIAIPTDPR